MSKRVASESSASPHSAPTSFIPLSSDQVDDGLECCAMNILSKIKADRLHTLRNMYQIPMDVHTRLPAPGKWCYTLDSSRVGIYESYLFGGLRLPLNTFARELLHSLGIGLNQLNPNGWRIIVAMQVLWRETFEGNHPFTVNGFLYYYKLDEIYKSLGFYQFLARDSGYRMIESLLTSDRLWKTKFFLILGFWIGDPIEVRRGAFPSYTSAMGRLCSKGMLSFDFANFESFKFVIHPTHYIKIIYNFFFFFHP